MHVGKVEWKGNNITIFPDFSKLVTEKRATFKQCKQVLHQKKIPFSLVYPAVLVLKLVANRSFRILRKLWSLLQIYLKKTLMELRYE